jgi:hypothetical protein
MAELKVGDPVLFEYSLRKIDKATAHRIDQVPEFHSGAVKKTGQGSIYQIEGDTAYIRMGRLRVPCALKDLKPAILAKKVAPKKAGGALMGAGVNSHHRFRSESATARAVKAEKDAKSVLAKASKAEADKKSK